MVPLTWQHDFAVLKKLRLMKQSASLSAAYRTTETECNAFEKINGAADQRLFYFRCSTLCTFSINTCIVNGLYKSSRPFSGIPYSSITSLA